MNHVVLDGTGKTSGFLDLNYTGPNHVWDGEWTVGQLPSASAGALCFQLEFPPMRRLDPGDYVVLVDQKLREERAEFSRIAAIDGRTVWLDRELLDSFGPADLVRIPPDRVATGVMAMNHQVTAEGDTGVWAMFVDGLTLDCSDARNAAGSAFRFDLCRNVRIANCGAYDSEARSTRGRGFDFYNCRNVQIDHCWGTGTRHAFHWTNTRAAWARNCFTRDSQDASFDAHGRNSDVRLEACRADHCVKIGNPSFWRGDMARLIDVKTDKWFQVHGGSYVSMIGCTGQNLLLAGYSADCWPTVNLFRSHLILADAPAAQGGPSVCINVTGPYRKCDLLLEECVVRSDVQGRWTRELFLENCREGTNVRLLGTTVARQQIVGKHGTVSTQ